MSILRIIIRFLIIAIAIGLLIFLSISLFRLIPAGINQLASATVSLGQPKPITQQATTTSTVSTQPVPGEAPVSDGTTGVYDTKGDIVILDGQTTKTNTSSKPVSYSNTSSKPTSYSYTAQKTTPVRNTTTRYYTTYTPSYNPVQYIPNGGKNLKITFTSIGVIRNGQYIPTNAFNSSDTVSMRFMILNEDYSSTGTWGMRVEMPAAAGADKVKVLNNLASIPGESSYTGEIRFDGIDLSQGTPVIRVYLDIYNEVAESNEGDNILAIELRNVTNVYNNTYNNNYNTCFNGTYYYQCNTTNNNTTIPNLYISTLEFGKIINGSFVNQTSFAYGDRIIVRARIRNSGGNTNNSWGTRFTLQEENNYVRDISSATQSPLYENGETTVTYELDAYTRGANRFTLYVDTQNNVSESNESDNSMQQTIQVY